MQPGGRRKFEDWEKTFIEAHYKRDMSSAQIGQHLNRSPESVRWLAARLGVAAPRNVRHYVRRDSIPKVSSKPEGSSKPEASASSLPVSPAMRRLAQFDPVIRRAMKEKLLGLAPLRLADLRYLGNV